jgi:hypothetical protein
VVRVAPGNGGLGNLLVLLTQVTAGSSTSLTGAQETTNPYTITVPVNEVSLSPSVPRIITGLRWMIKGGRSSPSRQWTTSDSDSFFPVLSEAPDSSGNPIRYKPLDADGPKAKPAYSGPLLHTFFERAPTAHLLCALILRPKCSRTGPMIPRPS